MKMLPVRTVREALFTARQIKSTYSQRRLIGIQTEGAAKAWPTASTVSREVFIRLPSQTNSRYPIQIEGKLKSKLKKGNDTEERVPLA